MNLIVGTTNDNAPLGMITKKAPARRSVALALVGRSLLRLGRREMVARAAAR